jgi:methionyl-tRNA formyltransferase
LQPQRLRSEEAIAAVRAVGPELLVLADYGRVVPSALLERPAHGALNVHPSLLPRYRGASPVQATILAGDTETGVTVIRMDAGVDTGPIVAQERTNVVAGETAPELEARLSVLGARVLSNALSPWLAGLITPRPQPSQGASRTPVLTRADGRIDWTGDAAAIERQVRAYQPWPGSWTESPFGQLVIWGAAVVDDGAARGAEVAGTVRSFGRGLAVATGAGLVELNEIQLGGRRRMSGQDLRNGYPGLIGARLA